MQDNHPVYRQPRTADGAFASPHSALESTILDLLREGYTVRAVAAETGVSKSAVHRIRQKAA